MISFNITTKNVSSTLLITSEYAYSTTFSILNETIINDSGVIGTSFTITIGAAIGGGVSLLFIILAFSFYCLKRKNVDLDDDENDEDFNDDEIYDVETV